MWGGFSLKLARLFIGKQGHRGDGSADEFTARDARAQLKIFVQVFLVLVG